MDRLSSYAVDPVSAQLALLNLLLFVYLACRGIGYASRVFLRRDPPRKALRVPREWSSADAFYKAEAERLGLDVTGVRDVRELIRSKLARSDES